MSLRIYLSGSIKKGRDDLRSPEYFWTTEDEDAIARLIPGDINLLNPSKTDIDRNDYFVNYGCDLYLVSTCDVLLVDLRTEKGIGVGAEMMLANHIGKPVVAWLPNNTYYRRAIVPDVFGSDLADWIHPFAFGLCDFICDTLESACETIEALAKKRDFSPRKERSVSAAIRAYEIKHAGNIA
jgi:hypothetical protein